MRERFIYADGRISGLGTTLLDDRMWQMLVLAEDGEDLLRFLGDTWYGRFMQQRSLDECFEQAMSVTEDELIELSEDRRLVEGILQRRDVRNARYLWKDALLRGAAETIPLERSGLVPTSLLSRAVQEDQARDEMPRLFTAAIEEILAIEHPTEAAIDARMDVLAVTVETSTLPAVDASLARFVMDRVEQRNYLTAARSRLAGLPRQDTEAMLQAGGRHSPAEVAEAWQRGALQESLAESAGFEAAAAALGEALGGDGFNAYSRECERHLLSLLDAGALPVFGPAPLAAFLLQREMEIMHLRIIAAAKAAGVPAMRLQDRLPRG